MLSPLVSRVVPASAVGVGVLGSENREEVKPAKAPAVIKGHN